MFTATISNALNRITRCFNKGLELYPLCYEKKIFKNNHLIQRHHSQVVRFILQIEINAFKNFICFLTLNISKTCPLYNLLFREFKREGQRFPPLVTMITNGGSRYSSLLNWQNKNLGRFTILNLTKIKNFLRAENNLYFEWNFLGKSNLLKSNLISNYSSQMPYSKFILEI